MAFTKTYIGRDDRGRRYVDFVNGTATAAGTASQEAAEDAWARVPFDKARAILVTFDTGKIDTGKATAPKHDATAVLAALEDISENMANVGVRIVGA